VSKPILPFLETMITQVCNISCLGCTNYSDLTHQGYVSWQQGKEWLEPWLSRIDIPDFGIMGGEPLINPEVEHWILGIRQLMPKTQIRFTTNALLLEKKWHLVDLMSELGNCVLKITVHENNPVIEQTIEKIFNSYDWKPVTEYGIDRYVTDKDFKFQINRPKTFIKSYKNNYANMMPYSSDPVKAFEICCQKNCPLLYQGRIYKCSTSGLLKETLERFGNPNFEQWKDYVTDGIGFDCTNSELATFINNFEKPEQICRMCPTVDDSATIDHYATVTRGKYA